MHNRLRSFKGVRFKFVNFASQFKGNITNNDQRIELLLIRTQRWPLLSVSLLLFSFIPLISFHPQCKDEREAAKVHQNRIGVLSECFVTMRPTVKKTENQWMCPCYCCQPQPWLIAQERCAKTKIQGRC